MFPSIYSPQLGQFGSVGADFGLSVPFEFNRNSKSGEPLSLEGTRSWFVGRASGEDILSSCLGKAGSVVAKVAS